MGLANYRIFGTPGAWRVDHDGKSENTFDTKEAAFEAAVAAASLALRQGHQVIVSAPGSDGNEAATGAREPQ
jgi:phosphotransferase system HPr-like phosphotransfer protein